MHERVAEDTGIVAFRGTLDRESSSPLASAIASATAATPAATVAASASAGPTSFTSKIYGYSLTVPAGWTANPSLHGVGRQRGTGS